MRRLPYYLEKFAPERAVAFRVANSEFSVLTSDGIDIKGFVLSGAEEETYVVVHGLMGHSRAPGYRQFAESLSRFGRVLTADLRGHGSSAGASTLGNKEALDVAALIKMARALAGTKKVTVVGFSMGAAAAIRAAVLLEPCDFLISVSSPAEWHGRRRWAAHRTALVWRVPGGTFALQMLTGVRIAPRWQDSESPLSVVPRIAPAPLLVVHGTSDQFFPPEEGRELFERAEHPKALWEIPGGGHAEGLFIDSGRAPDAARIDAFVNELVDHSRNLAPWR